MTTSALAALRVAMRDALLADATFVAALGGPKVYDEAPPGAELPYVTFGESVSRDWSTVGHAGAEHAVAFDVWSGARGRGEALGIAEAIVAILHDASLALAAGRLVNLRRDRVETRRESQGRFARASVRFRAVTEAP